jgi:hypothetical protein
MRFQYNKKAIYSKIQIQILTMYHLIHTMRVFQIRQPCNYNILAMQVNLDNYLTNY